MEKNGVVDDYKATIFYTLHIEYCVVDTGNILCYPKNELYFMQYVIYALRFLFWQTARRINLLGKPII